MSRLAPTDDAWIRDHFREQDERPQDFTTKRRNERIVLALVLVPDGETDLAYRASTDGNDAAAIALPKRHVTICFRAGERFALGVMPAWLVIDRKFSQSNVPGLCKSAKWTDDDRAAWGEIKKQLIKVRHSRRPRALKNSSRYHTAALISRYGR